MEQPLVMSLQSQLISVIRDVPDFPKPGILFKDITPVLKDAALCRDVVDAFHAHFASDQVDCIIGVESRGFLFGMMLAQKFNVPFIPVRKRGKLPFKTNAFEYNLEYGSAIVEMHIDAISPGQCVLIHDDLLATGGTAMAASELVSMQNGKVAGFAFLVELDFLAGRKHLQKYSDRVVSLVNY